MPLSPEAIARAVSILAEVRMSAVTMADIPATCRPETLDDAYAIQVGVHERLGKAGWGPIVGHKV